MCTSNRSDKKLELEVVIEGLEDDSESKILREKLRTSIIDDDIREFQQILRGIDVSKRKEFLEREDSLKFITFVNSSVFQFTCLHPSRPQFITECISAGCNVNKCNSEGRHPISYILKTFNHDNLAALLSNPCTDVDRIIYASSTPLNFIIRTISDRRFNKKYACLKLLVEHCADVNLPGFNGLTPIQNVLRSKNLNDKNKKAILKCFFDYAKGIDIDVTREELIEFMPDLELPPIRNNENQKWNFDRVIQCRKERNEDGFIYEINQFAANPKNNRMDLLHTEKAVFYGIMMNVWDFSLERLLRILRNNELNFKDLDKAAKIRNPQNWFYFTISIPNLKVCLDLIMRLPNINNDIQDHSTDILPPLDRVPPNRSDLILKFLERGVYISKESICKISPDVFEKHFDRCITSNGKHIDDTNLLVTYDYTNLISNDDADEMFTVTAMLVISKFRHLLGHPLIASFLYLKWIKLAPVFYMNFLLTLFFASSTIPYILICYLNHTSNLILLIFAAFFTFCLIVRELLQIIIISPYEYLKSFENFMEWPMIALMLLILSNIGASEWHGTIAAVAVVLIAYEMFILIRSLPFRMFSMHFIMLETVTMNFVKFFLLFSIIVIAFAFSFYAAFYEQNFPNLNSTQNGNASDDSVYNNFGTIGLSLLKTVVMVTGELDTSSIEFQTNASYLFFVSFILLVTTVLANLLVGLTVSDINEIRSEVALTHSIRRCQFLIRYGKNIEKKNAVYKKTPGFSSFQRMFEVFPEHKEKYEYQIRPNLGLNMRQKWLRNLFTLNLHQQMETEILVESLKRIDVLEKTGNEVDLLREQILKLTCSTDKSNELMEKFQNMKKQFSSMEKSNDFVKEKLNRIESMMETMQKIPDV